MLHIFSGKVNVFGDHVFLINDVLWIEAAYSWDQKEWQFFLYPYRDDNRKTISYYAFDEIEQRDMFEMVLKVSWIWAKTAFLIVQFPLDEIRDAIEGLDVKFFQNLPGIWPKTAKKLLLELKDKVKTEDFVKIAMDEKQYKNIVSALKNLWYESSRVKSVLQEYDGQISKETMGEVIKWVIGQM